MQDNAPTCPECRVGRLRVKHVTFIRQYGAMMITIPDVPAMTCDVCRENFYDPDFLSRVEMLVQDNAFHSPHAEAQSSAQERQYGDNEETGSSQSGNTARSVDL